LQQLDELHPIFDAVVELHRRWEELQTVELADRAYQEELAEETRRLADLQARRDRLEGLWQRRSRPVEADADVAAWEPAWGQEAAPLQPTSRPPPPAEKPTVSGSQARRSLARLLNRFRYDWQLEDAILGLVNRIVADEDRPLGEALVLLPWKAFEEAGRDTEPGHLERLAEWRAALVEYRGRLEADVDILEARFRGFLGIWELWRGRERDAQGHQLWRDLIDEQRRALDAESTRLRLEIVDLETRLREAGEKP
jgi:hypothetical protein